MTAIGRYETKREEKQMRWNRPIKVERPEYPKLVALGLIAADAEDWLPLVLRDDPDAEIVQGGAHGVYVRVHNATAEAAAKLYAQRGSLQA